MVRHCGERTRSKIHVIHCGVDPDLFAAAPRRREWPFQIVCVASLEDIKGHTYLVDACRILKDRGIDFECHLVGDGPQRRALEAQIARCGLEGRIRLHGGQPRPEVGRRLALP